MHARKTVVLVNQVTGPVFADLVNEFLSVGMHVTLITGTIDGKINESHNLRIVLGSRYDKSSVFTRIFTWIKFTIFTLGYLFIRKRVDVLLIVSNPPFTFFIGWLLFNVKRQRYILLVYDLYPEILQAASISAQNLVFRLWRRFNLSIFKSAEKIITIGDNMKLEIEGYGPNLFVDVVPTWVDTDVFTPKNKGSNYLQNLTGWTDKFIILYSGNLGRSHKIRGFLEFIKDKRRDPRFGFVFIGGGEGLDSVREFQKEHKLENLFVTGYVPFDELPASLGSSDVSIVSYGQYTEQYMVPSKAYFYLASGNPIVVLANRTNDLSQIVEVHDVGIKILNDDFAPLEKYLGRLADPADSLRVDKSNSRFLACRRFGRQNAKNIVNLCLLGE